MYYVCDIIKIFEIKSIKMLILASIYDYIIRACRFRSSDASAPVVAVVTVIVQHEGRSILVFRSSFFFAK